MSTKTETKSRGRENWLVGRWGQRDSDLRYEITQRKTGLKVRMIDLADGEESVVSAIKWDGRGLCFKTYTRSTNWKTINRVRPVSKVRSIVTLTYWETWVKIGPWLVGKKDPKYFFGDPRNKSKWIFGHWIDPEWWCQDVLEIMRRKKSKWLVSMGATVKISKITWNGSVLRFTAFTPGYKPTYLCWEQHGFRPTSHTRAEHEITEELGLIRYE